MPGTKKLDSAILKALSLSGSEIKVSSMGGSGFAETLRVTDSDTNTSYFIKTGPQSLATALQGEAASLQAIAATNTLLCPRPLVSGKLEDRNGVYLATTFLDLQGGSPTKEFGRMLAAMHDAPVVMPGGWKGGVMFGFEVPTSCGSTVQDNTSTSDWASFFGERRLRAVAAKGLEEHGTDAELMRLVGRVVKEVVPHLLGERLRRPDGSPIRPSLVHGDLWSGNAGLVTVNGEKKDVIFDPSSSYSHSEFELGIMRMFGGFSAVEKGYLEARGGKDEPVEEYEDRLKLYECYHTLNHYAIFGGGYKESAMGIMRGILAKYGEEGTP